MLASKYCTVSVLCLPCSCSTQKQTGHMVLWCIWRCGLKCGPEVYFWVGILTYLRLRGIGGEQDLKTHLLGYSSSFDIFCSPTSFPGMNISGSRLWFGSRIHSSFFETRTTFCFLASWDQFNISSVFLSQWRLSPFKNLSFCIVLEVERMENCKIWGASKTFLEQNLIWGLKFWWKMWLDNS
jgi:hypothetical protein